MSKKKKHIRVSGPYRPTPLSEEQKAQVAADKREWEKENDKRFEEYYRNNPDPYDRAVTDCQRWSIDPDRYEREREQKKRDYWDSL